MAGRWPCSAAQWNAVHPHYQRHVVKILSAQMRSSVFILKQLLMLLVIVGLIYLLTSSLASMSAPPRSRRISMVWR